MAGPCQGKGGGMGGLLFFYGANKQVENGKIEKSKQKRRIDHTGHPTADRPNSLPYYPRLWSSGTGVLSRDSLSQNGYGIYLLPLWEACMRIARFAVITVAT